MKDCIITDFEWCVTPHPTAGDYFYYFNEILSVGAVRLSESGSVTDRFYRLIRPENADFVHPIVLDALRLDRRDLAAAKDFTTVYTAFLDFIGDTPIYAWGCADQSALNQNLRVKAPHLPRDGGVKLMDIQPLLCRGFDVPVPYPGLSALLEKAGVENTSVRHNALSDAEDTARIAAALLALDPAAAETLFAPRSHQGERKARTETREKELSGRSYETSTAALDAVRKQRLFCPSCKRALGIGTWICTDEEQRIVLCACERCGKFVCEARAAKNDGGRYTVLTSLSPFEGGAKERYLTLRRAQREKQAEEKE